MDRYIEFALNHYILILALLVVTYLLIQEFFDAAFKKFGSVSPMIAVTKMNSGNTVVIDVREHEEYNKGHIEGAANIPLGKIKDHSAKLDTYKSNEVLIVCQEGTRASAAAKELVKAGLSNLFVISGGMQSWQDDYKLPIKINRKN
jgi:rhodanese-related sulfurtransferase